MLVDAIATLLALLSHIVMLAMNDFDTHVRKIALLEKEIFQALFFYPYKEFVRFTKINSISLSTFKPF